MNKDAQVYLLYMSDTRLQWRGTLEIFSAAIQWYVVVIYNDTNQMSWHLVDGVAVALKKLDVAPKAESDDEFLSQVNNLLDSGSLCLHFLFKLIYILILCSSLGFHGVYENLIQLLGFCVDGNLRVLAYEFAAMGSLHDILHGENDFEIPLLSSFS